MRSGLVLFLAVSVAAVRLSPLRAGELDPLGEIDRLQQQLFEKVAPAVVFLSCQESMGSGFFISADGLVLTNAHVVGQCERVHVVLNDGRKLQGQVVERAPDEVDLALVSVSMQKVPYLSVAGAASLRVGTFVASVGHNQGGIWTFNTGLVSNIYPAGHERPVFQTQIPLNPGSSGGPIVDRLGRVLGIVTAGISGSNNVNFGIRIDFAIKSLDTLSSRCECLTILAPKGAVVFVDGIMQGVGPRIVISAEPRVYEVYTSIDGRLVRQRVRYPETKTVELK